MTGPRKSRCASNCHNYRPTKPIMISTMNESYRISDSDRRTALDDLSAAVGEGRISLEEFEERSQAVAQAATFGELSRIFADLPRPSAGLPPAVIPASFAGPPLPGQPERRPKLAIALTTTVAVPPMALILLVGGLAVGNPFFALASSTILTLIVPLVWIALYVAKVGPDHWHQPTQAQIAAAYKRAELEQQRLEREHEKEQRKIEWKHRREQLTAITDNVMEATKTTVEKWNGRQSDGKHRA